LSGEKQGELSEESFPLHPLKDFYGEAQPYGCTSHFFVSQTSKAKLRRTGECARRARPNEQSEVEANRGVCPLGTAKRQR